EVGQDFPVQADGCFLEAGDETRIGGSELAGRGVDAHGPKSAEGSLLIAAMHGRENAGLVHRFLGELEIGLLSAIESAGRLEDFLAAGARGYCWFASGHFSLS